MEYLAQSTISIVGTMIIIITIIIKFMMNTLITATIITLSTPRGASRSIMDFIKFIIRWTISNSPLDSTKYEMHMKFFTIQVFSESSTGTQMFGSRGSITLKLEVLIKLVSRGISLTTTSWSLSSSPILMLWSYVSTTAASASLSS